MFKGILTAVFIAITLGEWFFPGYSHMIALAANIMWLWDPYSEM